ncbi:MAG: metal ABC transporter permease [Alphaproteobacteria bacterium]|nr:metal ABC transporter permease [Alphaproteobacteria bacterium]
MDGTGLAEALMRALTFRAGYNTGVAMAGAAALGAAAGGVGAFLFLRARVMAADAVGHATLPGVVLAFILAEALGAEGRALPGLLAGAAVTGILGMVAVEALTRNTRLAPDAAIAIALSVFYAVGVVLLSWVQTLPKASQGGLESFILGQAAALSAAEAAGLATAALLALGVLLALFRPLAMLCFDEAHARTGGLPAAPLDAVLLGLGVLVTVLGLQTVGLVLVVALLILPAVAARFWSERLAGIFRLSVAFGAGGAFLGAAASSVWPRVPTGASIVLALGLVFAASLLAAPQRGLVAEAMRRVRAGWRLRAARALQAGRGYPGAGLFGWRRAGQPTARGAAAVARLELWDHCLAEAPEMLPAGLAWGIDPLPPDALALLRDRDR